MKDETSLEFHTRLSSSARYSDSILVVDQFGGAPREHLQNFMENCVAPFVVDPQVELFQVPEFLRCTPDGAVTLCAQECPVETDLTDVQLMEKVWAETSFVGPQGDRVSIGCMMLSMHPDELMVVPLTACGPGIIIPGLAYTIENFSSVEKASIGAVDMFERGESMWSRPEVELFQTIVRHFVDYLYRRMSPSQWNMKATTGACSVSIH